MSLQELGRVLRHLVNLFSLVFALLDAVEEDGEVTRRFSPALAEATASGESLSRRTLRQGRSVRGS